MTIQRLIYVRLTAIALIAAVAIAGLGVLGEALDVGPGRVPIWDPDGRGYWVTGLVAVFLVGLTYFRFLQPVEPHVTNENGLDFPTLWVFPVSAVLSAVLLLGVYRGTTAIAAGALLGFVALLGGSVARHLMHDSSEQVRERARLFYTLLVHGVAFLSLSMIYIHKVRSIFSATAILIVTVLLLLALTEGESTLINRRIVYALVGGIMLGQVTWGLNYWQAAGWTGGAVLLIGFYLIGGLILTHLRQGVHFRDVAEYGVVGALAFAIVVYSLFV